MTTKPKYHIAVIFGGCSSEYKISLTSAASVIRHLNREKYEPVLIGITQQGDWLYYTGTEDEIADNTWYSPNTCYPVTFSFSHPHKGLVYFLDQQPCPIQLDAALPILHGRNGEDGTVQGLFKLVGIPLAGCDILASALCMDKERAHRLVSCSGIRVPKSMTLQSITLRSPDALDTAQLFAKNIGFPLFVKPVKAGSSLGITKITEASLLQSAIETALQYDDTVILEENIDGFEVGCAVLGTDMLTVGEVDEIELSDGFFDYTEKYTLKTSQIHVPARIDGTTAQRIQETAKTIYHILGCSGFARVDMFITPNREIVFNEVNTIPGFTEHSRFPAMMAAAGMSFEAVLDNIIQQALF